jgi:hypothetical protein
MPAPIPPQNTNQGSAPCLASNSGAKRRRISQRAIDITGTRYGRLVAITRGPRHEHGTTWLCQCDCGERCIIQTQNLRREMTRSCGCLFAEQSSRRLVQRRAA